MLPTEVLRAARAGFGLRRGRVRVLSTRFGKVCLAHRTADGTRTQIRLVLAQPDTYARLSAEARWLRHLATAHGLSVPMPYRWSDGALVSPPLIGRDDRVWHAVACTWITGRHLGDGMRAADVRDAGSLLARLHRANVDAPPDIAAARPTWWIPRLLALATTLRGVIEKSQPLPTGVSRALADGLQNAHDAIVLAHASLPASSRHVGLIHTDAHTQNMRWAMGGVGIVDFEDFATGRFMLDLAPLWGRMEARRNPAPLLDALLSGYDRVVSLPEGHMRDIRVMLSFRRLDYVGWILSWPRLDLFAWGPECLETAPSYIMRQLSR